LFSLFKMLVCITFTKNTIKGAKDKGNYTSAFNKIMINHMQLISMIG
jgi:hypothetical protein